MERVYKSMASAPRASPHSRSYDHVPPLSESPLSDCSRSRLLSFLHRAELRAASVDCLTQHFIRIGGHGGSPAAEALTLARSLVGLVATIAYHQILCRPPDRWHCVGTLPRARPCSWRISSRKTAKTETEKTEDLAQLQSG